MSIDLICVDPDRIFDFWVHARSLIKAAIEETNLSSFDDVEKQVLDGGQLLWLAWSDRIEAAATTHLGNHVLTIVSCSGHQMEHWLPLFAQIEDYARKEGCRAVRIYGRRGWERVLDGYRAEYVILEKAL